MNKVWTFLNQPLVVVLIALCAWPFVDYYSTQFSLQKMKEDRLGGAVSEAMKKLNDKTERRQKLKKMSVELIDKVNVQGVKLTSSKRSQQVVGTIVNNTGEPITRVVLTISYFDAAGLLVDAKTHYISNVKILQPGVSVNFSDSRYMLSGDEQGFATEVEVKVTSMAIFDIGD